jgi:Tol biopolymer transport system component
MGMLILSAMATLFVGATAIADFTFGTPKNLGSVVNSDADIIGVSISYDGLSLYFCSDHSGGYGSYDLWVAMREEPGSEWGAPVNLGPVVNSAAGCMAPGISADGLSLYFSDCETPTGEGPLMPGGIGSTDIWVITRDSTDGEWGSPTNLGTPVNHVGGNVCPSISVDGLSLYFCSGTSRGGSGLYDIWLATRKSVAERWNSPINLGPMVNTGSADMCPCISGDSLLLFFCSGTYTNSYDLYMSRWGLEEGAWEWAAKLDQTVNTSSDDLAPSISSDGRTLYFLSNRPGGYGEHDIWQAPIIPLVDFDGSGFVDMGDLIRLIEHWGQDEPSVDIGPMPWDDGVVDAADLEILMGHWGQEAYDTTLIAHWKLDDAEGIVAFDSAGANDGSLVGDPVWQPNGGKLGGALQLDGVDDCVATAFVRDPSGGPFSVFAWIKGGAPGQVAFSQEGGANWLVADPDTGALRTDLSSPPAGGRNPTPVGPPLISSTTIADDNWHRIGLTWDGSNRILYVDDVEVAADTLTSFVGSAGNMIIGTASTMAPSSFWSGLIDDVRIYDRVVVP